MKPLHKLRLMSGPSSDFLRCNDLLNYGNGMTTGHNSEEKKQRETIRNSMELLKSSRTKGNMFKMLLSCYMRYIM